MFHDRKTWLENAARRLGTPEGHGWYLAQLKPNSLAIARRIVHRHGGTIAATSPGTGCTVRFTLPR